RRTSDRYASARFWKASLPTRTHGVPPWSSIGRTSAGRRIWRLGTEGTIWHATNGRRKPEESREWLCRHGDDCQRLAQSCKRSDGSGGRCAGGLASKRPSARSSIPFPWHERPTKGTMDFSATWVGA